MPLSMERWVGKVAVVTGASVGIGAAIAESLVAAGVTVVGLARRKEKIDELANKLADKKGKLYSLKCDISVKEDVIKAINWVVENVGPIQILINNAGILQNTNLIDGDSAKWRKIFDVNLWGLSIAMREVIKILRDNKTEGHIINVNSVAGHKVFYLPFANVYPASKFALTALTGTFRKELQFNGIKNIKITSLSPGGVRTEIATPLMEDGQSKDLLNMFDIPMLDAKDIADSVIYVLGTPPGVEVEELTIQPVHEQF